MIESPLPKFGITNKIKQYAYYQKINTVNKCNLTGQKKKTIHYSTWHPKSASDKKDKQMQQRIRRLL